MFKVIKLKSFLMVILIIVLGAFLSVGVVVVGGKKDSPKHIYTIVLDAGHGGRDNGCTGVRGTKESEINLAIVKKLQIWLDSFGIRSVLTRYDNNGLYDAGVDNYKVSDLNNRLEIIDTANADMLISIHQNSFTDDSQCGAQVFYQDGDGYSKNLADSVYSQLIEHLPNAREEVIGGDYYLLKESGIPAIIVECGYLTNADEEKLLNDEEYQNKVAYVIVCGVVKYLGLYTSN